MEDITVEKIDAIMERYKVSYAEAKEALEKNNGNLVDTLIYLEQNKKTFKENLHDSTNELIETIKGIIKKGNVNRIKVKKDGKVLVDIPVNAGIVTGALIIYYPVLLAIGAVAALVSKITLEIERPDGKVDVVNDIIKNKYNEIKNDTVNATEEIKNKTEEKFKQVKHNMEDMNNKNSENEGNSNNNTQF